MKICKQSLLFVWYFLRLPSYKFHKFPLKNKFNGTAHVLVNGPSLRDTLKDYDSGKIKIDDNSFFVNLSALDSHFLQIKPKHYCLSDPMFYQDYLPKKDAIRKVYDIFNNDVDWDMYLYLCFPTEKEYDKLEQYAGLTNPHVKIIRMNRKTCASLVPAWRNKLYASGYFMPEDGTIANTAIYLALLEGYKEIRLYGADHNYFLEFAVNDNNELCSLDSHFYDKAKPVMKPFKNTCVNEDRAFRVHEFFYIMYVMFQSHDLLQQFSQYLGAHILNCTPGSMIDSYDRIKEYKNELPII